MLSVGQQVTACFGGKPRVPGVVTQVLGDGKDAEYYVDFEGLLAWGPLLEGDPAWGDLQPFEPEYII